jgi:6-phosphogluconolactonase (cycloisomerase 2 family)
MKFRKFGKTVLTAALSTAIVFSLSSCVRSFTVGYLYVTGTVTATPSGNGIITGFKIDNNTGKLNPIHTLPVGSGGANPVRIVLLSGGQFVYVLNRGLTASGGADCTTADPCKGSNIQQFAVGGNGVLTPQETFFTQGINPFRLLSDTSGNYLIALDHDAPSNAYCSTVITGATSCGDATVFAINATTGRLSLVVNQQLTSQFGTNVSYFPVPANAIDFVFAGSYLMTLAGAPSASPSVVATTPQTVFPYTYNSTNGQLSIASNTPHQITNGEGNPMGQATAIVYAGGKIYILDNEPLTQNSITSPSQILPFTVSGTNGNLSSLVGGATADDPAESSPIYVVLEHAGKFLYVLNQEGSSSNSGAGIAQFSIDPTSGQLSEAPLSPYGTGALPQCMLEDPSNQFVYTANAGSNNVTGRRVDANAGSLNPLTGAPGGALTGPATWCVATGRTN